MIAQDVGRQGGVATTASSLKGFVTRHLREAAQHTRARQKVGWSAEHTMMPHKHWRDLSRAQKTRIVLQPMVHLGVLAAVLLDIRRRAPDRIRGSKRLWRLAAFVQPIGPISYVLFGRKR